MSKSTSQTNRPPMSSVSKDLGDKITDKMNDRMNDQIKNKEDKDIAESDILTKDELRNFRDLLVKEKNKIIANVKAAIEGGSIKLDTNEMMDEVDLASATIQQNLTFRLLDRERKLLAQIERALTKIKTGDYGYCEGTGEAIPKRRLELAPWTRHSVKHKEHLEKLERSGRSFSSDEDGEGSAGGFNSDDD